MIPQVFLLTKKYVWSRIQVSKEITLIEDKCKFFLEYLFFFYGNHTW